MIYYKAVRPDGTDFYSGTVQWAPPPGHEGEWVVTHPAPVPDSRDAGHYFSVSTVPTDCTGFRWPCRLWEIEAVGPVWTPDERILPNTRAGTSFRVPRELPGHEAFGTQGAEVVAMIERVQRLTCDEIEELRAYRIAAQNATLTTSRRAVRGSARRAARGAALEAAWNATWVPTGDVAWDAAWDAISATLVRDLIDADTYVLLMLPWRAAMGRNWQETPA